MSHKLYNLQHELENAVNDARNWSNVCEAVAQFFDAKCALFIPFKPDFQGIWMPKAPGMEAAIEQYVGEGWHVDDYRRKAVPLCLERGWVSEDDIVPSREAMKEMPYYRDFVLKHDIGFFIGIRILTPNGYWGLGVYYRNDHPPITKEQIELTEQIRPYIEDATKRADLLAHKKISDFAKFFNGAATEVYVFDPQGQQCFGVDTDGNLKLEDRLSPYLTEEITGELNSELKTVCASAPEDSVSRSYQIKRDGDQYNILAIQIPPSLRHYHMHFKVCVIVTQCGDEAVLRKSKFEKSFQLTNAEITTIEMLSAGNRPNQIAELLSVQPSTIRQRLKDVYEKTDTNSQIELIGLYNNF